MLIAFAVLPFFSTLLGGAAAIRLRHRLHPFMAFAAGILNNAGPSFRYVFAACGMLPYHPDDPKII